MLALIAAPAPRTTYGCANAEIIMQRIRALILASTLCVSVAAQAQDTRIVETKTGPVRIETLARGLESPWGLAFLPDGRMLVTERTGRLRIVSPDGALSQPLRGVPEVLANGQGGLLDVAVSPAFAKDRLVYLSYSTPGQGGGAATALMRARLVDGGLENAETIFRQRPAVDGGQHFGSRIVFARDGALFLTLGDRGKFTPAQDTGTTIGKVVRIMPDGAPAKGNAFAGKAGALPEIFSLGHRNIQGAALHPRTGELWVNEMGPRGGDEINRVQSGRNYGWPLVSWGDHYDGRPIPKPDTRPDLAAPAHYFKATVAPSGMTFYQGDAFPAWRGSMLIGGLVGRAIVRLEVEGERVTEVDRIPMNARVRDVRTGPDGAVYALTDAAQGRLLKLTPVNR